MTKNGNQITDLAQLVDPNTGNVYLAEIPIPPNGEMLIRQNTGKEKHFTHADSAYKVTNGRGTYTSGEGTNESVDFYLGGSAISNWESTYHTSVRWQDAYWRAQNDFSQSGLVQMLTSSELAALLPGVTLRSSYPNQSAEESGKLYLRSATVVLQDGTLADVQMLATRPAISGTSRFENYRTAAFIVDGTTYVYKQNGILQGTISLHSASVATVAEAVQGAGVHGLDWFVQQITTGGFAELK